MLKVRMIERLNANGGILDWQDAIQIALYDSQYGYYICDKKRVGKEGADFFTSVSLDSELFAELLAEAFQSLCGKKLEDFEIIEIGSEPQKNIFKNSKIFRIGDEIKLAGNCFVVSNELLDAQSFCRFKIVSGVWKKVFLKLDENEDFSEIFLDADISEKEILEKYFPTKDVVEGHRLDVSFSALKLFENLCLQDWCGVLLFADYFRTCAELLQTPLGTARAYFEHKASYDLLKHITGGVDITFSPPAEIFIDILKRSGFSKISCENQGAFFVKNSSKIITHIAENFQPLSKRKRNLMELIGPAGIANNFRILAASR